MKLAQTSTTVFRKQFSISQEDMANYLGISYSSLAMHERGGRPLATKALIKFGELLTAYEKAKRYAKAVKLLPAVQTALDKQHEQAITKMQYRIADHRRRVEMLQHKLKVITAKQEGATTWLHIIYEKLATLPKTAAAKADRLGLEEMHGKACDAIPKTNAQKLKLQLGIALLEAAADVYEAHQVKLREGKR